MDQRLCNTPTLGETIDQIAAQLTFQGKIREEIGKEEQEIEVVRREVMESLEQFKRNKKIEKKKPERTRDEEGNAS